MSRIEFELPVDCNDVEMFPASPDDRDVMPKTRGLRCNGSLWYNEFSGKSTENSFKSDVAN